MNGPCSSASAFAARRLVVVAARAGPAGLVHRTSLTRGRRPHAAHWFCAVARARPRAARPPAWSGTRSPGDAFVVPRPRRSTSRSSCCSDMVIQILRPRSPPADALARFSTIARLTRSSATTTTACPREDRRRHVGARRGGLRRTRQRGVRRRDGRGRRALSSASLTEALVVVQGRQGPDAVQDLRLLIDQVVTEIVPLDSAHAEAAFAAWQRFGKGRHPAGLNLGDCFSYATARLANSPLLFKGDDFAQTDLAVGRLKGRLSRRRRPRPAGTP